MRRLYVVSGGDGARKDRFVWTSDSNAKRAGWASATSREAAGSKMIMGAGRENGCESGELARQAQADWGGNAQPGNRQAQAQARQGQERHGGKPGSPPQGLGKRLGDAGRIAGGVISGPRERAALAQATQDAARAGYGAASGAGGFGQPAPRTVPLRGEFTMMDVQALTRHLTELRPFRWIVYPHETRIGSQRYYVDIVHLDYPRVPMARTVHDQYEFYQFLMDERMNDAPMHLPRATPLPAGHRR